MEMTSKMETKAIGRKIGIEIKPAREVSISKIIVGKIEKDLSDRAGLSNEWHEIDDDIKREIRNSWMEIIDKEIAADYHSWT
jgi:hypothetical protein